VRARLHDAVPGWPPLAGVAALLLVSIAGSVAPLPAAAAGGLAGLDGTTPALTLLAALLFAAAAVLVVAKLAGLTRPVKPAQLGVRMPDDPARALVLTALAALGFGALVALAWALTDLSAALPVPAELDTRSVYAQAYELPVREPAELGAGLAASVIARCVIAVAAMELVLRGFAFPALSGWKGLVPAALIIAVAFGGLGRLGDEPAVALLSMALAGALCWLYVATGSLLPGTALSAGAAAAALGAACALPALGIAVLAVACAVAAPALAAAVGMWRPGAPQPAGPPLRGPA
jgi:membrane protease YdiL (CAAX protease family)